jgi:hypothetical protein
MKGIQIAQNYKILYRALYRLYQHDLNILSYHYIQKLSRRN